MKKRTGNRTTRSLSSSKQRTSRKRTFPEKGTNRTKVDHRTGTQKKRVKLKRKTPRRRRKAPRKTVASQARGTIGVRTLAAILVLLFMVRLIDEKTFKNMTRSLYPRRSVKKRRKRIAK